MCRANRWPGFRPNPFPCLTERPMKKLTLTGAAFAALIAAAAAAHLPQPVFETDGDDVKPATFKKAVRIQSEGKPISTENPGYASPAWYDVNGDGRADLVVGQFKDGKMKAYHQAEDGSFGKGQWIMAGKKAAEVPGVW